MKHVTQFLAIFDPLPLSHFVTHPGTPKSAFRTPTQIFNMPTTTNLYKSPLYKFSLNCSRGLLSGGFLSGRFCQGWFLSILPYVRIHLLQQKVKNHFTFHVSYMYV